MPETLATVRPGQPGERGRDVRLAAIWDAGAEYCDRCSLSLPYAYCFTCEKHGYQPNGVGPRIKPVKKEAPV